MPPPLTIYHNPRCSTSRRALAILEATGRPVRKVEYLAEGWTRAALDAILTASGLDARGLLRAKEPLARELGLLDPGCAPDAIIAAMIAHPALVERPVVVSGARAILARPPERLVGFLEGV